MSSRSSSFGSSSSGSSTSTRICRNLLLDEIKDARNQFGKSNLLGSGGEAKVYLTKVYIHEKDTRVAVKHLLGGSNIEREVFTVHNLQHHNIVSLIGYCVESSQNILVYEFMKNGALSKYVKDRSEFCLSWKQRVSICLDAARGLDYLHNMNVIHRDVKPGNILLDANLVGKISDFGISRLSNDQTPTLVRGTPGYIAPEYNRGDIPTPKIDVYAFGVVLFEVLCLKKPWTNDDESYVRRDTDDLGLKASDNVDAGIREEVSANALAAYVNIIRGCLEIQPNERPTMEVVVQDLELVLRYQNDYEAAQQLPTASREQQTRRREPVVGSSHVHDMMQLESDIKFTCDSCNTVGGGKRYSCVHGDFNAHMFCSTCPRTQNSFIHPQHTLRLGHSEKEAMCLFCSVCDETIKGKFYKCENCDFDVHPLCTQLPQNLTHVLHPEHRLDLHTSTPSICKVCHEECASWRYGCKVCSFNIHVECVNKNSASTPKNKSKAKVTDKADVLVGGGILLGVILGMAAGVAFPAGYIGAAGIVSWEIFKVFKESA